VRCDPRCPTGLVCFEGQCTGVDNDIGPGLDIALDAGDSGPSPDHSPSDQTPSEQTSDQATPPDQTPLDLGPPCTKTLCGTTCVDTQTSQNHCGQCDRSCGGGSCTAGVCQPIVIASGLDAPYALAVSGNGVFWARNLVLQSCPKASCVTPTSLTQGGEVTPPSMGSLGFYGNMMVADGANVFWINKGSASNYTTIRKCAASGCTAAGAKTLVDNYTPIRQLTADATNLYWVEHQGGAHKIALSASSGGQGISGTTTDSEVSIAVDATKVYVASSLIPAAGGGAYDCALTGCSGPKNILFSPAKLLAITGTTLVGTSSDKVIACTSSGCGAVPVELAAGQTGVSAITADSVGVYWAIRGSGTAADGSIRMCKLPTCAGGVRALAASQAAPVGIVVDGDFVYWVNNGITGSASSGSVLRVRR